MVIVSIASPLRVENGTLAVSVDAEVVRDAIVSILLTQPLERVMQPTLGFRDVIHTAINNTAFIVEAARQALERELGQYVFFNITADVGDDGIVSLNINYTVDKIIQPTISVIVQ